MRRLTLAAILLLVATPTWAGDLGLFGSYWDTDELGDTAGAGVKYALGDAGLRFELRGSFYPDLSRDLGGLIAGEDGDLEVEAIVPEAGITFNFSPESATQFYLGAGLSYYLLDAGDVDIDDEAGFYGLAGFATGGRSGGAGFFAEVLYRSVEATLEDNALVEKVDLDLSGPSINMGVIFRF